MFGDMVDSTPIGEELGPDSMHELIKGYQLACSEALIANDGVVERWMGDGFMAYFGYPSKHEDAAVRAVEAGLAVVRALDELRPAWSKRYGVDIQVRIGIHTGLVIVARLPGRDDDPNGFDFVGGTPNLASRIEQSAPPGTVVISDATRSLVRGFFDVEPLDPRALKGIRGEVRTHRVLRRTGATSRLDAQMGGLTPL